MRRLGQHLIGRLGDYGAQARPGAGGGQQAPRRPGRCRWALRPAHRRAEASRVRRDVAVLDLPAQGFKLQVAALLGAHLS